MIAISFSSQGPAAARAAKLQARIGGLAERVGRRWQGIRLRQRGGTIILEGAVASEYDRRVVEHLVRLEPGVYEVDNRLEVNGR
jgi:osmotically-inducible protein OsmY